MIGQRINNYEIVEQIGEGGMGSVYMARHPVIDRRVAVKVLRAGMLGDAALVNRFFNEARAANAIRHPNIIDIIDVGTLGDGTPYLMMELLEGENLAARIKRAGRLDLEIAVDLTLQTAGALGAAHTAGIVHRDLKPENLFLTRDRSTASPRERVKVLDFGIAKLRGTMSGAPVHTQTGALMGTPPYMSPEQCRGISSEVDQRTDVYALGIILYEMLCGSPPFVAEGFGEVLVMHLTKAPEPPRQRNPEIPEAVERVILQALAKRAEERLPSMERVRTELTAAKEASRSAGPVPVQRTVAPAPVRPSGDAEAPRPTTTLSAAAGEFDDLMPAPRSGRRNLIAGGAALGVVGGLLFAFTRGGAPVPIPSTAPVTAAAAVAPAPPPDEPPALKPDAGVAIAPATTPAKAVRRRAQPTKPKEAPPPSMEKF